MTKIRKNEGLNEADKARSCSNSLKPGDVQFKIRLIHRRRVRKDSRKQTPKSGVIWPPAEELGHHNLTHGSRTTTDPQAGP